MCSRRPNFVLITMDEVRPDHLPCYGYPRIRTPGLDSIAARGVVFAQAVSTSPLTPVAHASLLTGQLPPRHGLRTPFDVVQTPTLMQTFREAGYRTGACVGVSLLGSAAGFARGCDWFDEPRTVSAWRTTTYDGAQGGHVLWGNSWTERLLDWIRDNHNRPFAAWGHYFECHEGAEVPLLEHGVLQHGRMSEWGYYDAKIELMDRVLFAPLVKTLSTLGIMDRTYVAIGSDHGTNLGEHEVPFNQKIGRQYPQHVTLYECDLRIPLVLAGPDLPKGLGVDGLARQIDIAPTLLELAGIEAQAMDGASLVSAIHGGCVPEREAYAEELFALRGPGDYQAMRNTRHKLILDRRRGAEEFFDLSRDPHEVQNLSGELDRKQSVLVEKWRDYCDRLLVDGVERVLSEDDVQLDRILRDLGYIE